MSSKWWVGGAAAVQQVDRFTPASVGIGDVFTLTVTGEDGSTVAVSFTATAATVANVTAGLTAAWNTNTNPLCTPITAADATTSLTLTADVAGVPFSVASSTTDGNASNTQTLTRSAVTASAGPKDWNTAVNWSDAVVPVSTDTVTFDNRAANAVLYGLNQSAVTLASLQHYESMRYDLGTNTAPLRVSATICDLNRPAIDGSRNTPGNVYLDTGSNATTLTNYGGPRNGSGGLPPVCVKGAHASNVARVYAGNVGFAVQRPGDTANFPSIAAYNSGTSVFVGSGCSTVTTLTGRGADLVTYAASTTIDLEGGTVRTEGSGAVTTFNCNGAATINSTGTIGTLNVEDDGSADTTKTSATRTVTTCNVYGDGALKTDRNTTYTNGVNAYRGCHTSQIDFPDGTNLVIAAAP